MQVRDSIAGMTSNSRRIGYEFQDESQDVSGRFNSVASLTTTQQGLAFLNGALDRVVGQRGGSEIKWSDIGGHDKGEQARKTVETVIEMAATDELRIDVLTWYRDDLRHRDVRNPDRLKEQVNMRSTLSARVRTVRWGSNIEWHPHPDQLDGVDWEHMDNATGFKERKYKERMPETDLLDHTLQSTSVSARTVPVD